MMELMPRPAYLQKLLRFKNSNFIKVITGVRRGGKSYLLLLYKQYLEQHGVSDRQIIYLSFEDLKHYQLRNMQALYAYLQKQIIPNQRMYFLLDEIQLVDDWQEVVNSLRLSELNDITITGSNAQILSGDLSTRIAGRYVEIKVYPLSFQEFAAWRLGTEYDQRQLLKCYRQYLQIGGFPAVALADADLRPTILSGIYNTILLKDINVRSNIRDANMVTLVSSYLADTVGQLINPNKIVRTLQSSDPHNQKLSYRFVAKLLRSFQDAYLFERAERYDIRGRKRLTSQGKYYIVDQGLRRFILGSEQNNRGSELENVVYLELLRRGYQVEVGKLDEKEIDFIASKGEDLQYVQVTLKLPENSTRETDNLLAIPNNFQKLVISGSIEEYDQIAGIPVVNIIDWLLNQSK
ncbi:MAG: ATP-binding protein [Lactobacillus sp.]|jgi:predicted AAA+ superfamily ATPase|nr:ATP-binding protein [Lactobacillus sp.]